VEYLRGITHARSGQGRDYSLKPGKAKPPKQSRADSASNTAPHSPLVPFDKTRTDGVDLCDRKQEIFVTDARELFFFCGRRKACRLVNRSGFNAEDSRFATSASGVLLRTQAIGAAFAG